MTPAAVWLRVSTGDQETENQRLEIERFTAHHGYDVQHTYEVSDSAWNGGKDGGEYRLTREQMLGDAWHGRYRALIVWSLDRLTRGGVEDALRLIRQLRERNAVLVSVQEPWLSGSAEVTDLMVAFAAWMAEQESRRRSERVRAGMARARAEGKKVGGRKAGARDRRPRRTDGYTPAAMAR